MNDESKQSNAEIHVAALICQYCEANLPGGSEVCLRCGISTGVSTNPYQSPSARVAEEIALGTNGAGTLVSILLTVTLFTVLLVVGLEDPGFGFFLAVITIPPWLRTALVLRRRSATGLETRTAASVSLFVSSLLVTWLILFVTLVCCLLTFFFVCVGALSQSGKGALMVPMAGIIGISVLIVFALVFSKWIRRRFLRDTKREY